MGRGLSGGAHHRQLSVGYFRALPIALTSLFLLGSALPVALAPASPASADAARERRGVIRITENAHFDAAHGVRSGSGTAQDPYVISGWDVAQIVVKDTDAHLTIADNTIRSALVLDWIGRHVNVHHNDVGDLRVNQNVRRTGEPTSGVIEHNTFAVVGQLRHWDGAFQHNTVGRPPSDSNGLSSLFSSGRAVNFDGFNGAVFANNTIFGYMDARLHGHHHSSGFEQGSHDHSSASHEMVDHSKRHHQVWITNNKIQTNSRYGLAYLDTLHVVNDRTAASERNPELNAPHVHHTRVHMTDNELVGSGLAVMSFNADDRRHTGTTRGLVDISRNRIHLADRERSPLTSLNGIYAESARDLTLSIAENVVTFDPTNAERGSAVLLQDFDAAAIHLCDNEVRGSYYGIRAATFSDTVTWAIHGLRADGVTEDVSWDQSVKNEPQRHEGAEAGGSPCSGHDM